MQNEEIQAAIEELLQHVPDARPAFEPGKTPIPASGKVVGKEEKALMVEAALDGWLTTGRWAEALRMGVAAGSASAFSPWIARREQVWALYDTVLI